MTNSNLKLAKNNSKLEYPIDKSTLESTFETIFATSIRFKHPNFGIKAQTIYSIFPLFPLLLCCKNLY